MQATRQRSALQRGDGHVAGVKHGKVWLSWGRMSVNHPPRHCPRIYTLGLSISKRLNSSAHSCTQPPGPRDSQRTKRPSRSTGDTSIGGNVRPRGRCEAGRGMRSLHARRAPGMAGGRKRLLRRRRRSLGSLGAHGVRSAPWSGREVGEAVEPHLQVLARLASEEELLAADGRVDGELQVEFALESDGGDRGEGDPPLTLGFLKAGVDVAR